MGPRSLSPKVTIKKNSSLEPFGVQSPGEDGQEGRKTDERIMLMMIVFPQTLRLRTATHTQREKMMGQERETLSS